MTGNNDNVFHCDQKCPFAPFRTLLVHIRFYLKRDFAILDFLCWMYRDIHAFSIFLFIMFVADDLPRLVNKVSGVCQAVERRQRWRQLNVS